MPRAEDSPPPIDATRERTYASLARGARRLLNALGHGGPVQWLVIATALFAFVVGAVTPHMYTVVNVEAILYSSSIIGIAGIGTTIIMVSGGLVSLAIGETAAIAGLVFLPNLSHGLVLAFALAMALGAVVTAVQGWLIGAWQANPIVVTITAAAVFTAIGEQRSQAPAVPATNAYRVLNNNVHGLSVVVFVLVGVTILAQLFLTKTRLGQTLYLTGENRDAARAAGLPIAAASVAAFAIAGALFAVSGVFIAAQQQTVTLQGTSQLTFEAIAAALVGGNAITGGFGSAIRTFLGAVVIAAVADLTLIRGYDVGVQGAVEGLLVVVVVVLGHLKSAEGRR